MTKPLKPFLKWPGGKRWLVPEIKRLLEGRSFNRYFEPFLGGGAVFFGLRPERAFLSDINEDLINTYRQVRDRPVELQDRLREIPVDKETYLSVRATVPECATERAVRFLYLNRTAFGGLYRLNRQGLFNVPFGGGARTPELLWRDNLLVKAAAALEGVEFSISDFESALSGVSDGDLVYCDPTYTVVHNSNGFVRYNERNFTWGDQERLALACQKAASDGALVLVTNAATPAVKALYTDACAFSLERHSTVSPIVSKRQHTSEYLFFLPDLQPMGPSGIPYPSAQIRGYVTDHTASPHEFVNLNKAL